MTRLCAACETPLPADARPNRPYCDRRCRANAYAARQRAARTALVVELPVRDGALAEQTLVQAIERAAADPWRAAAWLLERRWPERWSTSRKPPTASGDVDEFDPFAEVDQIAEQRRKRLPTPLT
jgi:hypothetical protein